MSEMVHYIVRFIMTMKHVIYGAILSAALQLGGLGERCKLPQWGLGRRKSNLMHFSLKIWWHQFSIFPDFSLSFPKKYFPLTFPWPLKFPDFFQFSLTCRNPVYTSIKLHHFCSSDTSTMVWTRDCWAAHPELDPNQWHASHCNTFPLVTIPKITTININTYIKYYNIKSMQENKCRYITAITLLVTLN